MPKCLEGIDTSFFTNNAEKRLTPITRRIQNHPMSAIDLLDDSDDDEVDSKLVLVQELVERSLKRSFDETGAGDVVVNVNTGKDEHGTTPIAAIKRVNMITDDPANALGLTKMLVEKAEETNRTVDSPAVKKY